MWLKVDSIEHVLFSESHMVFNNHNTLHISAPCVSLFIARDLKIFYGQYFVNNMQ